MGEGLTLLNKWQCEHFIAATLKKTRFVYRDEQFITIFVMCDKQKEEMERLFESFIKKLAITNTSFVRSLMNEIEWEARLIGIKGARELEKQLYCCSISK